MMGFVSAGISCSCHASIARNFNKSDVKLQSFTRVAGERKTHFMNFNLGRSSTRVQKLGIRMPICCLRGESIDVEERRSANEEKFSCLMERIRNCSLYGAIWRVALCPLADTKFTPRYKMEATFSLPVSKLRAFVKVRKEIERCYQLIHRLGRGVIYIGSARPQPDHPHYIQSHELSRRVANLLGCTTWTGAGPGLMDAVTRGALEAGKSVGGFKIEKEAGQWTSAGSHPYLPPDTYLTCRFFSARKHGFVDAAVRNNSSDRTAVIALPGGIGTLDEMFEILSLIQLQRIGSQLPIPVLLMNYDAYYSKLLDFLGDIEHWGNLAKGEVESLWKVFENNQEALAYLARFYDLPSSKERAEEHETGIS